MYLRIFFVIGLVIFGEPPLIRGKRTGVAGIGNSEPDFSSTLTVPVIDKNIKPFTVKIKEAVYWELKAKNGGLYASYQKGGLYQEPQLKRHAANLSTDFYSKNSVKNLQKNYTTVSPDGLGLRPSLNIVTTSNVKNINSVQTKYESTYKVRIKHYYIMVKSRKKVPFFGYMKEHKFKLKRKK